MSGILGLAARSTNNWVALTNDSSTLCLHLCLSSIIYFIWKGEGRARPRPLICWVTPQMPAMFWTVQEEARSQEVNPGPPYGWQRPNYINLLLPPRVYISRKLASISSRITHLNMGSRHPKQHLKHCAKPSTLCISEISMLLHVLAC